MGMDRDLVSGIFLVILGIAGFAGAETIENMEFTALHYDLTGTIRQRVGNSFAGTIPSGHFQTKDGKWVSIAVGNDKLFKTLCERIGRLDWLKRPEFKTNNLRNENRKELDDYTEKWINEHTFRECFDLLGKHDAF